MHPLAIIQFFEESNFEINKKQNLLLSKIFSYTALQQYIIDAFNNIVVLV